MPNAHRFALAALLLLGSAVLAGLVVTLSTPRYAGARVPPARELPWPTSVAAADRTPPFVLLYVSSSCGHCSRAAVLVDSLLTARRIRGAIVTNDTPDRAASYCEKLRLTRPLAYDSGSVLIHAIGTHAVPTLVLFHADGSRQLLVGFAHDEPFRRAIEALEQ
ncbi:MAG: TlpA family protein disulfide reductase [Gemmatimonadaceae bacterium]